MKTPDASRVTKSAIGDATAQNSLIKAKEELAEVKYIDLQFEYPHSESHLKTWEISRKEPEGNEVKGRLRASYSFWESIGTNQYILSVIREGYKIPLMTEPKGVFLKNNRSALEH